MTLGREAEALGKLDQFQYELVRATQIWMRLKLLRRFWRMRASWSMSPQPHCLRPIETGSTMLTGRSYQARGAA